MESEAKPDGDEVRPGLHVSRTSSGWLASHVGLIGRTPSVGAVLATCVTLLVFSIWADFFLTFDSATSYLTISSELGIIAIGIAMLMIVGEFDLSVGSVLAFSAAFVPLLMTHGVPAEVAILVGFVAAGAIGATHGIIVTTTEIPSLIVTLASLMVLRGVVLMMTGGFPVPVDQSEPIFKVFASQWHEIPVSVLWFGALTVILSFVLLRTPLGSWIFATGGGLLAARKSGIPTTWVKIGLFMLTSLLAATAGMIQMTRFASVDPLLGQGIELTVIAAAVIGGCSLKGGHGSVVGAAFGVITFGMIQVGLQLASVPGYFFQASVGFILLAAMTIQIYSGRISQLRR